MADMNIVLEGLLKYREGKKWKSRWCVVRKLSPVADRLHISLYKDSHDCSKNGQEKAHIPLEDFFGIEHGFPLDKEPHVMAIVCQKDIVLLAFPKKEELIQWEIRIRSHLGEEHQFPAELIKAPPNSRCPKGSVKLYIQGPKLCITCGSPPRILGTWKISDLRKFGVIDNKFCFVGGTGSKGVGVGVHAFFTEQGKEITDVLTASAQGKQHPSKKRSTSAKGRVRERQPLNQSHSMFGRSVDSDANVSHRGLYASLDFMNERRVLDSSHEMSQAGAGSSSGSDSASHTESLYMHSSRRSGCTRVAAIADESHGLDECLESNTVPKSFSNPDLSSLENFVVVHPHTGDPGSFNQSQANTCDKISIRSNSGDARGSHTLPRPNPGSKPCLFKSHGQPSEKNGSQELLSDIFRDNSLEEFDTTGGSGMSAKFQDIHTSCCSIGSSSSSNSTRNSPHCSEIKLPLKAHPNGGATGAKDKPPPIPPRKPLTLNKTDESPKQKTGKVSQPPPLPQPPMQGKILQHKNQMGEKIIHLNRPLEYVDLGPYDGLDDGYLYWQKSKQSSLKPIQMPSHNKPKVEYENFEQEQQDHGQYMNIPTKSTSCNSPRPNSANSSPIKQRSIKMLSYHDSLRRQRSQMNPTGHLKFSVAAKPSKGLIHYYEKLKDHEEERGRIARRKSLEDVIQCSDATWGIPSEIKDTDTHLLELKVPPVINRDEHQGASSASQCVVSGYASVHIPPRPVASRVHDQQEDYILMGGVNLQGRSRKESSLARSNSVNSKKSDQFPLSGNDLELSNYLVMTPQDQKSGFHRSQSMREPMKNGSRPHLNHSKSLDNELDEVYLEMGSSAKDFDDILYSSPPRPNNGSGLLKPFENLIEHQHYSDRKILIKDLIRRNSKEGLSKSNSEEGKGSTEELSKNGNKQSFFSKLMRRHSSSYRENKNCAKSRSQDDILSAAKDSESDMGMEKATLMPRTRCGSLPGGSLGVYPLIKLKRKGSLDLIDLPEHDINFDKSKSPNNTGLRNLTDEQKQSYSSLLGEGGVKNINLESDIDNLIMPPPPPLPPPPPRESIYLSLHQRSSTPPELPPKDFTPIVPPRCSKPKYKPCPPLPPKTYLSHSAMKLDTRKAPPSIHELEAIESAYSNSPPSQPSSPYLKDRYPVSPPPIPEKTLHRRGVSRVIPTSPLAYPDSQWSFMHTTSDISIADDEKSRTSYFSQSGSPGSRTPVSHHTKRIAAESLQVFVPEDESIIIERDAELEGSPKITLDPPPGRKGEDIRLPQPRSRIGSATSAASETTDTISVSSVGSSDTHSGRSDDHKSSPASTTLRPRTGKEYTRVDRRKLAEDLNVNLIDPKTPQSPSIASVFTFDVCSTESSRMSYISTAYSTGNDSPRSPSLFSRQGREPDYVNVAITNSRTDSPKIIDMTPPGSPRSLSSISEISNPILNYAEIDLTQTDESKKPRKLPTRIGEVEYAMIDMVATSAASRVGKEHAQLREDSLRRKDSRRSVEDNSSRRSKDRKTSTPLSHSKERKGSYRAGSSKDRKFSAPL